MDQDQVNITDAGRAMLAQYINQELRAAHPPEGMRAINVEDGSLFDFSTPVPIDGDTPIEAGRLEFRDYGSYVLDTQTGRKFVRLAMLERVKVELAIERMRLAACGVAALGYFQGCVPEYDSASLQDVLRLRVENDLLRQQIAEREAKDRRLYGPFPNARQRAERAVASLGEASTLDHRLGSGA